MDKVSSNIQSRPVWERSRSPRGHHSSVSKALEAHRERTLNRQARVESRLNMVKEMNSGFFPQPQVEQQMTVPQSSVPMETVVIQNQAPLTEQPRTEDLMVAQNIQSFEPLAMDEIYKDAQLGSTSDNALAVVEKELANPEEGPVDDVPRGSYVDYTV